MRIERKPVRPANDLHQFDEPRADEMSFAPLLAMVTTALALWAVLVWAVW